MYLLNEITVMATLMCRVSDYVGLLGVLGISASSFDRLQYAKT